jgi:large subunit ribosomal protein L1
MKNRIQQAINQALDEAPERKFVESLELAITIKDVDLKNPANRIQEEVRLPNGRGKQIKIAMFASGEMAIKAKEAGIDVIDPTTIEELAGNKMDARRLANRKDFFLSEIAFMGDIGRYLGVVLGPRGKMPRPVPPTLNPANLAQTLQNMTVVRSRDKVTFHTSIGTRAQNADELTDNAMAVWDRVISKLDRGSGNIRSLYVKTTMGPAIRVEVIQ